jgi:hypothetical protein
MAGEQEGGDREWVPVPDPTQRTEAASERQLAQYRRELADLERFLQFRLDRLRIDLDAVEHHHDDSLDHWMKLIDEKFRSVDQRFADGNARAKDAAIASKNQYMSDMQASKDALKEAFSAAKELQSVVAEQFKTEIAALRSQAAERGKSVDQQLAALNKSIDRGEPGSYVQGERAQKTETRSVNTLILGVMGTVIAALVLVVAVLGYVAAHHG